MNDALLKNIRLQDPIFAPRQKTGREVTIPSCIRRCGETGRIKAFRLQWKKGEPDMPHIYWDSDVAKVLEGMAASLMVRPDPELEKQLDELVDLIISAQQPDGYLNTHFTVVEPEKRWTSLAVCHELYCAGHLMEAAVAHYEATGKRNFLDCMCRYADYIATVFGRGEGQKRGYPGHEEIELALVKLYRATGEKRYLELARYFVEERGTKPNYYVTREDFPEVSLKYLQADRPVREQEKAAGHAVRAMYLFAGVTDVAAETGDPELLEAAERVFRNVSERQLYITGGVGSTRQGEAFTYDFGLPNDTAYAESCAAIGLAFFAKRLLDATGKRDYAEIVERVLYNNGMNGISLRGDTFFYANQLEVNSTSQEAGHVYSTRQPWFNTSCCPTNYCRFLPRLGLFCADASPDHLRIDIPAAMTVSLPEYEVRIESRYPYDGKITATIRRGGCFTFSMRIPAWCGKYSVTLNGNPAGTVENGYWTRKKNWQAGEVVTLDLDLPAEVIYANPGVPADFGRAAIRRGPVVYCLESVDNPDILLHTVRIPADPEFTLCKVPGLPEGTEALQFSGTAACSTDGPLYSTKPPHSSKVRLCAIPYALWQNRGASSMQVFLLAGA